MQWDLIEEHHRAYDEKVSKKINELTDLFDMIIDDMKLYPYMICVDVFPCIDNLAIEIPEYIWNYYETVYDEQEKINKIEKFELTLNREKSEIYTITDELRNIFEAKEILDKCVARPLKHRENIECVANILEEHAGTEKAECFMLGKKDLEILCNFYIGILFSGWVLNCGRYGILILLGTNE